MTKRSETEHAQRQVKQDAMEAVASDLATKAEPHVSAALNGGGSGARINSETAHRIAAAIARDTDRGTSRPLSEYINEARRR